MSRDPGGGGGGEIAVLVADQKARRDVHRPEAQEVEDQSRGGLAPVARPAIGGDDPFRVERAIADIVDVSAYRGKLSGEVSMHATNFRLAVQPARDAGLIGHEEDKQPGIVEHLDRRAGTLDPAKPLDRADVAVVVVDDAVAVEKRRGPVPPMRNLQPRPGEIGGDANVDEIAIEDDAAQQTGAGEAGK